jgi:hypothetical protein
MKRLNDALKYRGLISPPRSTRSLIARFNHVPHNSVTALLRKTGPFIAERDGYQFTNSAWSITEEDAVVLRERYQRLVDQVALVGIEAIRSALGSLSFTVLGAPVGLSAVAIDVESLRTLGVPTPGPKSV